MMVGSVWGEGRGCRDKVSECEELLGLSGGEFDS